MVVVYEREYSHNNYIIYTERLKHQILPSAAFIYHADSIGLLNLELMTMWEGTSRPNLYVNSPIRHIVGNSCV